MKKYQHNSNWNRQAAGSRLHCSCLSFCLNIMNTSHAKPDKNMKTLKNQKISCLMILP